MELDPIKSEGWDESEKQVRDGLISSPSLVDERGKQPPDEV